MKINLDKHNYKANTEKILSGFKISSPEDTINMIINNNCSITRFGDGEFDMIFKTGMNYQKYDEKLSKRLKQVLDSNEKGLLVGINNVIDLQYAENYVDFANAFWNKWLRKNKFRLLKILSKNKQYYSSNITRFYMDYKDKSNVGEYIKKLQKIWDNKDVVIVEGQHSRLGVGNDLFDNMKSIQRIICPSENAFDFYIEILEEITKVDKSKMIMIALGPTATVLAYDLHKLGYMAVDIGHVDVEYEWFLRKATKKVRIETKYVTEVADGRNNIQEIQDSKYENQIICRII